MDDFRQEANQYRQRINSLDSQITQTDRDITALEQEKSDLRARVRRQQADVTKHTADKWEHQGKLDNAKKVQREIMELKEHAASTKRNVGQALPELHKLKDILEEFSTLVQEKSLNVSLATTLTERWVGMVPIAGSWARKSLEYRRQKAVVEEVIKTLDKIQADLPKLLPGADSGNRFIEVKPWNDASVEELEVEAPIPEICYR